jgi:hypothetical protein
MLEHHASDVNIKSPNRRLRAALPSAGEACSGEYKHGYYRQLESHKVRRVY